ncbi:MAG: energy transducer TonB, partial [Gammaproteobacteria bacterium]|nr:energy transducer TonB [Gammaproteobacteria bacterium]
MSATINQRLAQGQAGNVIRIVIGLVVSLAVTLSLFWLMQYLIETADRTLNEDGAGNLVDFVRVKRDESIQRRQLKPKKPPPPDTPPPQPPTPQLDNLDANAEKIAISEVPVETDIEMTGGFSLGVGEGDYLPIVKVAPIYPNRALTRGIEGFCVVQYTVTKQGTTKDPV